MEKERDTFGRSRIRSRGVNESGVLLYLSRLLAGRLVLGSLTEVFHSLAFGQEVLLLRYFLTFDDLVEQLPVKTSNTSREEICMFNEFMIQR